MNTTAKPTPGEWKAQFHHRVNDEVFMYWINAKTSVATSNPGDIDLCAEAGTVYHETGLTPLQLASGRTKLSDAVTTLSEEVVKLDKQRAELIVALERAQHDINWMLNNRQFLNGDCFNYLDEARAKAVPK